MMKGGKYKVYSVRFYKDKDGNEPLKEYLKELGAKTDKNSRINFNKITRH